MPLGLVGQKIGMSRVFTDDGKSVPVTVIEAQPNRITQVKTLSKDGYSALQVTVGNRRPSRVTKAQAGHYAKASVEPGRGLWEFRFTEDGSDPEFKIGTEIKADIFAVGQKVDVRGTTIGKGFAGVMKRHRFSGGRATHGNSLAHRSAGSIGQNQDPGRVFPGKKMAGHMGNVQRVQQNLEVVRVDTERNLILVKGSVPGPKGFDVIVQPAGKAPASVDLA